MGGAPVCAVFRIRYYQVDVERVLAPDSRKSAFAAVVTRLASFTVELQLPVLLLRQGVHDLLQLQELCILLELPHFDGSLVLDAVVVCYNLQGVMNKEHFLADKKWHGAGRTSVIITFEELVLYLTMASAEILCCGRCGIDMVRFHWAVLLVCIILTAIIGQSGGGKLSFILNS